MTCDLGPQCCKHALSYAGIPYGSAYVVQL